MDTETFQGKVLEGVDALQKRGARHEEQIGELIKNYSQLDQKTKDAFEELTKIKNQTNVSVGDFTQQLKRVNALLNAERRAAFGDRVLERILSDEEKRERINLFARMVVDKQGDMAMRCADRFKAITGKALGEDSSPGSTLINDALLTDLYDVLATYGIWSGFDVVRVGTKTNKMLLKTARPVANWILTEGGEISDDTNKAGSSASVSVEVLAVLLNVSLQLLEDAETDVAGDILNDFREAAGYRLDWSCLQADGTSDATDGGFTGIFAGGTAAAAASGNTTVETLDYEDVLRCLTTVAPVVLSRMAKWWIHPQMLARMLAIKDSNGRPIFLTATEAPSFGAVGSLLGYPVVPAFAAPSTNTAGNKVAVFGDPRGERVMLRKDWTFESSDHHKWNTLQRSFRAYGRAAMGVRAATSFAVLTLASS